MRAIQKPMGLRSVGTAKCQNYFLNKKHRGGGAMAAQRIAPQRLTTLIFYAATYATDSRNKLTLLTQPTSCIWISDEGGRLKQIRRMLLHADSCPKSDALGCPQRLAHCAQELTMKSSPCSDAK